MTETAKLIKIYYCFIEKDMMESAILNRDWDFIYEHMREMSYCIKNIRNNATNNININKLKKLVINSYTKDTNNNCLGRHDMPKDSLTISLDHFSEEYTYTPMPIIESLDIFINMYLKADKIIHPDSDKHAIFHNSLNEYHNALSHMMPLFYADTKGRYDNHFETSKKNIKKAQSHLIRGILDSCKSVIDFKMEKIISDTKLMGLYRKLRKNELRKIGFVDEQINQSSNESIMGQYISYINKLPH